MRTALTLYHSDTMLTFNNHGKKASESIVGKGENAGHQHFLLSPQCFLERGISGFNPFQHIDTF